MVIQQSLAESEQLQQQLAAERGVYNTLADFGSRLFFVLADLVKLNHMYQFSLNEFIDLFHMALKTAEVCIFSVRFTINI